MKLIGYLRVSTQKQGHSGLGLDAQAHAIQAYARHRGRVLAEFVEIESGQDNARPELTKALQLARLTGATLVIAKLDRLSRNAAFLLTLRESGAKFVAADMPDANDLTIGIMALVAQQEREAISKRTAEALAAAKRRGVKLGNPRGAEALRRAGKGNAASLRAIRERTQQRARDLRPVIETLQRSGVTTLRGIAKALNEQGILTKRAGAQWSPSSVAKLMTMS